MEYINMSDVFNVLVGYLAGLGDYLEAHSEETVPAPTQNHKEVFLNVHEREDM